MRILPRAKSGALLNLAIPCQSLSVLGKRFGLSIHRRWITFPKSGEKKLRLTYQQRQFARCQSRSWHRFRRVRCGFLSPVQGLYQALNTRLLLQARRVDLFSGAGGMFKAVLEQLLAASWPAGGACVTEQKA